MRLRHVVLAKVRATAAAHCARASGWCPAGATHRARMVPREPSATEPPSATVSRGAYAAPQEWQSRPRILEARAARIRFRGAAASSGSSRVSATARERRPPRMPCTTLTPAHARRRTLHARAGPGRTDDRARAQRNFAAFCMSIYAANEARLSCRVLVSVTIARSQTAECWHWRRSELFSA